MKASELRIGNYIQFRHTETPVKITLGDFVREYKNEHLEDYEPIPLTEEWLVKFGFEKVTDFQFSIDDSYLTLKVEDDNWDELCMDVFIMTLDMHKPFYITCIEYVHQLQNLYFALTGTELETK